MVGNRPFSSVLPLATSSSSSAMIVVGWSPAPKDGPGSMISSILSDLVIPPSQYGTSLSLAPTSTDRTRPVHQLILFSPRRLNAMSLTRKRLFRRVGDSQFTLSDLQALSYHLSTFARVVQDSIVHYGGKFLKVCINLIEALKEVLKTGIVPFFQ